MSDEAHAHRDASLAASDAELLAQCETDRFRASGPGGQKRNKTESAVRLRHRPTGVSATATESRSQHENRARALRRLREALALELRAPVALDGYAPPAPLSALLAAGRASPRQRREASYLLAAAALLDLLDAVDYAVADAARLCGATTGALSKLITADEHLLRQVNEQRARRGLRPLRR
jgi:hypothetical protein